MSIKNQKLNINDKAQSDFLSYANSVIKSRAIPTVEDNLKPVHRRILYGMYELGLHSTKKHSKSAKVVGAVMGSYHPHGDSAIYEALVRLSQPWKMRYPLIDIQGNSGSISGDSAAAQRYTETKLSPIGDLMLQGINNGAVRFRPNYDETLKEPTLLPSIFPNILCNANDGIAVGMSTNLAPHNLKEVVEAITAYIKFKNITIDNLMKFLPGPDYPTGGTIINADKIRDIYHSGSGTITLRSKYQIEEKPNGIKHIVITEIPYLVNIDATNGINDQLKKLVIEDGYDLIDDMQDASGGNKVNIRLILKKGANVYRVLDTLWKETRLQITQRISNTVIVDGMPKVLNLKEMIEHYVNHRHNVIINIAKFDLEKVQNKILVTEALLKALAAIDAVVQLIKESENKSDARQKLIKFLSISAFQADAILDMKLSRLSKLDNKELQLELTQLQNKEKELKNLISNPSAREQQMISELYQMSSKYGDERRTVLVHGGDVENDLPIEKISLLFFGNGSVYATQRKPGELEFGKRNSPLNAAPVSLFFDTQTDKTITVFTKDGTLTHVKALTLALETLEDGLLPSVPLMAMDMAAQEHHKEFIISVTSAGTIKKTPTKEYYNSTNGSRTVKLRGDEELIFMGMANDSDNIMVLDEKMTFHKVSEIRPSSKVTIGVKGIASNKATAAAIAGDKEKIFMINQNGQAKLVDVSELTYAARAGAGQVVGDNPAFVLIKSDAYFIYDGQKNSYFERNPITRTKTADGTRFISTKPIYTSGKSVI